MGELRRLSAMAEHYRDQYGDETDALFSSMSSPRSKIALKNPFLSAERTPVFLRGYDVEPILNANFHRLPSSEKPLLVDGLQSHYFLDLASAFPPLLLPIEPGASVLDMCSAPGGKLLVMISRMIEGVSYMANDLSAARAARLKKVLIGFLPTDFIDHHIRLSNRPGTHFGLRHRESFDAALLDAPCSSEAHVVNDPKLLSRFRGPSRSLPIRQYSLLCAALLSLKPGGHVVYATCSINKKENEEVIKKVLAKKADSCLPIPLSPPLGDRSPWGVTILPHRHGAGPMFFSLLQKK